MSKGPKQPLKVAKNESSSNISACPYCLISMTTDKLTFNSETHRDKSKINLKLFSFSTLGLRLESV